MTVELRWPGKYDDRGERTAVPRPGAVPELRAAFDAGTKRRDGGWCDRLILGDNLLALDALVREHAGEVDLVYIDPPFATGGKFAVATRVGQGRDGRPPREVEAPAYSDRFEGGLAGFLAMLDPRLRLIRELLAPHGSLYIHVDPTVGHAVKLLADEVFGAASFQREIVWRIGWVSGFKTKARNWIRNHDLIFFYTRDPKRFTFNKHYVPYPEGYTRRDGSPPKGEGMPLCDVWNASDTEFALTGADSLDSIQIKSFSTEKSGYATQKNESLLRRIVQASSNPGDLVADVFCGSGTTLVAASESGRRFVGCDCGVPAVHIATKRLLGGCRAHPLRVESVDPAPRFGAEQVAAILGHHGAKPGAGLDPFAGRKGRAAVHVATEPTPVTDAELADLRAAAAERGMAALHVLARNFELSWPRERDASLLLLRIGPEVFAASESGSALRELPHVDLAVERNGDEVRVQLRNYAHDHPRRLPAALRTAARQFSDLVDYWSLDPAADGDVHRPKALSFRTHASRDLDLTLAAAAGSRSVVRLVDVLYHQTEIDLTHGRQR